MKRKLSLVLMAVLTICAGLILWQSERARRFEERLLLTYAYALNEVETYVTEIEELLLVGAVTHDPYEIAKLSTKLHTFSHAAISAMGQLPIIDTELDNTALFLSQTGEFGHALSLRHLSDGSISEEEQSYIAALAQYAGTLKGHLNYAAGELRRGTLSFEKAVGGKEENFSERLYDIEGDFQEYPEIIYEGAHSADAIQTVGDADLLKERALSETEIKDKIHALFGVVPESVSRVASVPPAYTAMIEKDGARRFVSVTENGGRLMSFINDRILGDAAITEAAAKAAARDYLTAQGFGKTELLTSHNYGGEIVLQYAATQDGVVLYPDLLLVKVAADTGEITGFDATGYYANHRKRSIEAPTHTLEEALKIRQDLQLEKTRLAIIPTASGKEVLCHELIGTLKDKQYFLYINAMTGREEELFLTEPKF